MNNSVYMLDPVAFYVLGMPIRWYSLSYLFSFAFLRVYTFYVAKKLNENDLGRASFLDDFVLYCIIGVILGGRLGYVLFYDAAHYFRYPIDIFKLWLGGMSFHGGFLGVLVAVFLIAKKHKVSAMRIFDIAAPAACIGIFLGRLANFVNGELYGRVTDVPWGMVFPRGGDVIRHPSQIYEAFLEGLFPFCLLHLLLMRKVRTGYISMLFVLLYSSSRVFVECFREPDANIGYLFFNLTAGQLLCVPMMASGIWLYISQSKNKI